MPLARSRYYLRYGSSPLCDHMGCLAGSLMCRDIGVTSCSYRTVREARVAMRRLNARPGYAGIASVVTGECPRVEAEAA